MNNEMIIRAWTDAKFRASLTAEQRAALPAHPAGALDDSEILGAGLMMSEPSATTICCKSAVSGVC